MLAALIGLLGRGAVAAEDPFAELRRAHIDRILVADAMMNPTDGEGVLWIREPGVIRGLLSPIQAGKGGAFLCGYHFNIVFFSGERTVRAHRLNTECHDYVVEDRGHSFRFEGKLAARWQPFLDRMTSSTGQ